MGAGAEKEFPFHSLPHVLQVLVLAFAGWPPIGRSRHTRAILNDPQFHQVYREGIAGNDAAWRNLLRLVLARDDPTLFGGMLYTLDARATLTMAVHAADRGCARVMEALVDREMDSTDQRTLLPDTAPLDDAPLGRPRSRDCIFNLLILRAIRRDHLGVAAILASRCDTCHVWVAQTAARRGKGKWLAEAFHSLTIAPVGFENVVMVDAASSGCVETCRIIQAVCGQHTSFFVCAAIRSGHFHLLDEEFGFTGALDLDMLLAFASWSWQTGKSPDSIIENFPQRDFASTLSFHRPSALMIHYAREIWVAIYADCIDIAETAMDVIERADPGSIDVFCESGPPSYDRPLSDRARSFMAKYGHGNFVPGVTTPFGIPPPPIEKRTMGEYISP